MPALFIIIGMIGLAVVFPPVLFVYLILFGMIWIGK